MDDDKKSKNFRRNTRAGRARYFERSSENSSSDGRSTNRSNQRGKYKANGGSNSNRGNRQVLWDSQMQDTFKRTVHKDSQPLHPIGFKKLEEMLIKKMPPDEVLLHLVSPRSGVRELLTEADIKPYMMTVLIQVIGVACTSRGLRQNLITLLNLLMDSSFLTNHLPNFVVKIPKFEEQRMKSSIILDNIFILLQNVLDIFPSKALEKIEVAVITCKNTISQLEDKCIETPELVLQKLGILEQHIKHLIHMAHLNAKLHKPKSRLEELHNQLPPNNFRDLSIIPTTEEIHAIHPPFIRPNISEGAYLNAEHYLDVQFRLLREDFVAPLRNGIAEYLLKKKKNGNQIPIKIQDIRIYYNVHILHPVCTWDGVFHMIQFDIQSLPKVRWEATKRLIYGSLVCLSKDDFQTMTFATVVNRDLKNLKEGLVLVRFENNETFDVNHENTFVMAETQAYFEAYCHVLKGLQETTEESLPLKDYIVNANRIVQPPKYLNDYTLYDLSCLTDSSTRLSKASNTDSFDFDYFEYPHSYSPATSVPVLQLMKWPSAKELKLDPSQLRALQAGLTREMAVIQGPPGTGKTYVGLKLVQVLLNNRKKWSQRLNPLFVVCFTNHALDQFLEGILQFTNEVVRVGGRSTNLQLEEYNLAFIRRKQQEAKETASHIFQNRKGIIKDMLSLRETIEEIGEAVKGTLNGIVHENFLEHVIDPVHYHSLVNDYYYTGSFHKSKISSFIMEWLCLTPTAELSQEDLAFISNNDSQNLAAEEDEEEDENAGEILEEAEMEQERRLLSDADEMPNNHQHRRRKFEENLVAKFEELKIADEESNREDEWKVVGYKNINKNLLKRELKNTTIMSEDEVKSVKDIWQLPLQKRWSLYRYWIAKYRHNYLRDVKYYEDVYNEEAKRLKEIRKIEDLSILHNAEVIGMTTSGSARLRTYLQELKPAIVVVEEAAEVLEAHIITSLTQHCKHLILIGDHQQLRPNPTVYRLAKDYKLDISLFERLINNGVPFEKLLLQHRMRPCISKLLVPHIYESLQDHPSVFDYERVKGVSSNMYFISHNVPEKKMSDTKSHANEFEARYIANLCKYFLDQGYKSSQITVLTTYLGQLYTFKKHMRDLDIQNVRVTVVDNFQGEENDIILLSLVRSNIEGSIGFLKIPNRICVALSRAKKGLYCIGNFNLLAEKENLWRNIVLYLKRENMIGSAITAYCQNHPKTVVYLQTPEDFKQVPDGGCMRPCEFRLPCGHQCEKKCHPTDPEHLETVCKKNCTRMCKAKLHLCPRKCGEDCGECIVPVLKFIPQCGHQQDVPCHLEASKAHCSSPCPKFLPCHHPCPKKCGDACAKFCEVLIQMNIPCGHRIAVPCYKSKQNPLFLLTLCDKPCRAVLQCEHQCKGKCGTCYQGRLHESCQEKCERLLVCGHTCQQPCAKSCLSCTRPCENRCPHSRCPLKCGYPCSPCREPCIWHCEHQSCSRLCFEPCDRLPCDKPCQKKIKCGHPCIGLCGEPCPSKCRICDAKEVTEIFFESEDEENALFVELEDCGHVLEVTGLDKWMSMNQGGTRSVQMKTCPKCKTIIRQNLRYGQVLKSTLDDILEIKSKLFGRVSEMEVEKKNILKTLDDSLIPVYFAASNDILVKRLQRPKMPYSELNVLENQVNCLSHMARIKERVMLHGTFEELSETEYELKQYETWLMKHNLRFSEQELTEIYAEIDRLSLLSELYSIAGQYSGRRNLKPEAQEFYDSALKILKSLSVFNGTAKTTASALLTTIKQIHGCLCINEEEKVSIVKALNLKQGHWFKCPNNHYYIITECGGAMVEGSCPDCKAAVGGTNHMLRADNHFAPEMDGALYPAWSPDNYVGNFDLNELMQLMLN